MSSTPLRSRFPFSAGRDTPVEKWESINVWEGRGCHHHDCFREMLSDALVKMELADERSGKSMKATHLQQSGQGKIAL
jgi:hypothetical protein